MRLAFPITMDNYYDDIYERDFSDDHRPKQRILVRRGPSPGIAAVLSVLVPGLGQVYNGHLASGAVWFLAASFGYWAILVPGLLIHAASVWTAYRGTRYY